MKALIIDDEPDIRIIARLSMERGGGWSVLETESGREGVALALAERPDVIILDAVMPEMDGLATLAALQASEASSIPVIFLTATAEPVEVARLEAAGARGVLRKPFSPRNVCAQILAMLEGGELARPAVR